MKYDFDRIVDRDGTNAVKTDVLPEGMPEDCLSLWVADMDFPCAEPIIKALHERVDRRIFGYTVYDNKEYKSAVTGWFQRRYGWEIDPEDIFFSPGVVPGFTVLINILSEPGDGVIVQQPVYYPFTIKIEANDRRVVNNALIYRDGHYEMDYEDLEQKLADPANKGILFCSPHNPVGRVWTEKELRRLVDLCKKYGKWIIADEIHCDLTRKGVTHHPLLKVAGDYQDHIFACTAPSKSFNLAGMSMSNIIIPNKSFHKKYTDWITVRNGNDVISPFGQVATVAAYTEGEEWLEQVRDYIDGNIAYVKAFMAEHFPKVVIPETEGTYLMWIDFNGYCSDAGKLERWMQQEAGIALDEGYIFGEAGKGFERINVASPRCVIEQCMERMLKAFPSLTGENA